MTSLCVIELIVLGLVLGLGDVIVYDDITMYHFIMMSIIVKLHQDHPYKLTDLYITACVFLNKWNTRLVISIKKCSLEEEDGYMRLMLNICGMYINDVIVETTVIPIWLSIPTTQIPKTSNYQLLTQYTIKITIHNVTTSCNIHDTNIVNNIR